MNNEYGFLVSLCSTFDRYRPGWQCILNKVMSGEPESKDCQVIVVSNRLPYQIDQIPDVPDRNHDQTRVQSGKILTER